METIHEILMNAAEEDLSVLIDYYDAALDGINYKAKLALLNKQDKVAALLSTMKKFAKNFFIVRMEYNEIVLHVAKSMDVVLNANDTPGFLEIKIASRFIADNFAYIPKQQRLELLKILKQDESETDLKSKVEQTINSSAASLEVMYAITSWLANATLQAFLLNKGDVWEATGAVNRFIRKILGEDIFRKSMILPIIHIAMLRCQYCSQKTT